jgi:hypothetical protein
MLGVMRETLEREGGSMRGDEDFFSVARTTPFVAAQCQSIIDERCRGTTFDAQRSDALIDSIEGIFCPRVSVPEGLNQKCRGKIPI